MAIETLTINGNGTTISGWVAEGGDFTRIQSDDGDTTRLYSPIPNQVRQFAITNTSASSGATINSVKVYFKFRSLDPVSNTFQIGVRTGSTDYWSANKDTVNVTTYVLFSETWTTNPNTSSAWTSAQIDALEIGVRKGNGVGGAITYGYVEVDYTAGGTDYTVTINDTLSLSDSVSKVINKEVSDTLSLSDSLTKNITKLISDSVSINDSISKQINKNVTDSLSINDNVESSLSGSQSISDTLAISDTLEKEVNKSIAETLSVADNTSATLTFATSVSDTLSLSDEVSKEVQKQVSDTVSTDDNVSSQVGNGLTINESLSITDSLSKEISKLIEDILGTEETVTTDWLVGQTAVSVDVFGGANAWNNITNAQANNGSYADVTANSLFDGEVSEAIQVTNFGFNVPTGATIDGVEMRVRRYYTVPSGSASVIDWEDGVGGSDYPRLVVGGTYTTVGLQGIVWGNSPRTDTFGSSSELWGYTLSASDINASNFGTIILPAFGGAGFGQPDATAYVDYVEMRVTYTTLGISDSISKQVEKSISDSVSLSDTTAKQISKEISDSIEVTDLLSAGNSNNQSISDTVSISDNIEKVVEKVLSDTLSLNDSVSKNVAKAIQDTVGLSDDVSVVTGLLQSIYDSLEVTDDVSKQFTKSLQDTIEATDEVNTVITFSTSIADSVSINDSLSKSVSKIIGDSVTVTDEVSTEIAIVSNIDDLVTVLDQVSKEINKTISDSISIDDNVISINSTTTQIDDTLALQDAVSKLVDKRIDDTLTVFDLVVLDLRALLPSGHNHILSVKMVEKRLDVNKSINTFVVTHIEKKLTIK